MKTKSYAALLLTTAFLVGCGDGGSSSNNQKTLIKELIPQVVMV